MVEKKFSVWRQDFVRPQPAYVLLDTSAHAGTTFHGHSQSRRGYAQTMAVSTAPAREKRRSTSGGARKRKSKKEPGWFAQWWPLLLGIAVTPLAIHAASIMALAGP